MYERFRTKLPPISLPVDLSYHHTNLHLGSCFAQHIGKRMQTQLFPTLLNPFGIIYHPLVLAQSLRYLAAPDSFSLEEQLFEHQGLWHSWSHHGVFSGPSKMAVEEKIQQEMAAAAVWLARVDRLFLTFGTAWYFQHKASKKIVANCHKVPASAFDRIRAKPTEIVDAIGPVLASLKHENPELEVVLTVSPVRHLKDGMIENQRSKAILLLAAEALTEEFSFVHYFPSYELVMDDLRDYRFYKKDMIHPGEVAIDYIWDYFLETLLTENALKTYHAVSAIIQMAQHRPLHPDRPVHQRFLASSLGKIKQLEIQYPHINFQETRLHFERQLID